MKDIVSIIQNGFTSFFVEIAAGVVMFIFNIQILKYMGNTGVGLYSVITNTAIIVTCLCNGINQAAQPLLSVNYGAGLVERVEKVKALGIKIAFIVCSVIAVVGMITPDLFTYIFIHPTKEILAMSQQAIRIYFSGFFVMGITMFIIGYFQATLKPLLSLALCLARGCVFCIIFVYVLPPLIGDIGIWMAMPLAELLTLIIGVICIKKVVATHSQEIK